MHLAHTDENAFTHYRIRCMCAGYAPFMKQRAHTHQAEGIKITMASKQDPHIHVLVGQLKANTTQPAKDFEGKAVGTNNSFEFLLA